MFLHSIFSKKLSVVNANGPLYFLLIKDLKPKSKIYTYKILITSICSCISCRSKSQLL